VDPAAYDAWYASARGRWIGDAETRLLLELLTCRAGDSILDVGCGTGYFSRRLAQAGFHVTGIDPDPGALEFAVRKDGAIRYLRTDARKLPFEDHSFDCAVAVTSLCFIEPGSAAVREMWRVARRSVVLGLLNRNSLLWFEKRNAASVAARAGTRCAARSWRAPAAPRDCPTQRRIRHERWYRCARPREDPAKPLAVGRVPRARGKPLRCMMSP
jgi:SAM-dependent methyltransferase